MKLDVTTSFYFLNGRYNLVTKNTFRRFIASTEYSENLQKVRDVLNSNIREITLLIENTNYSKERIYQHDVDIFKETFVNPIANELIYDFWIFWFEHTPQSTTNTISVIPSYTISVTDGEIQATSTGFQNSIVAYFQDFIPLLHERLEFKEISEEAGAQFDPNFIGIWIIINPLKDLRGGWHFSSSILLDDIFQFFKNKYQENEEEYILHNWANINDIKLVNGFNVELLENALFPIIRYHFLVPNAQNQIYTVIRYIEELELPPLPEIYFNLLSFQEENEITFTVGVFMNEICDYSVLLSSPSKDMVNMVFSMGYNNERFKIIEEKTLSKCTHIQMTYTFHSEEDIILGLLEYVKLIIARIL